MNLKDFLEDCKQEQIIDQSQVDRMYAHFLLKKDSLANQDQLSKTRSGNGFLITVSIIGVILIGFGIIYLFAHNWDTLSRSTKTLLSLAPVIIAIGVNFFTVTKRKDNVIWQETAAVYSFLAVGSMLALILQVYQLPGIENYFFTYWCVLCLPLVYILQSHAAVFCAIILMMFNLSSYPMDQSSIIRVPWFGSLLMFTALVPYFKRLFTLRQPESLYITHQIIVPIIVCLIAIVSLSGAHSSVWLLLFLILLNFNLFGTSIFLRNENRMPTMLSIISYVGLSVSMSYLLFYENWDFKKITELETQDHRLVFIPVLILLALLQTILFFRKEKLEIKNSYKLFLFVPLIFVILNYYDYKVLNFYSFTLFAGASIVVYFAQQRKDEWQLYPTLGIISVILISLSVHGGNNLSYFLVALIPSLYYLVPTPMKLNDNNSHKLETDHVLVLCAQFILILLGSFEGFWIVKSQEPVSSFKILIIALVAVGLLLITFKHFVKLQSHVYGFMLLTSLLVPLLVLMGCILPFGVQHIYSIVLLLIGIVVLIFSARKSNLTVANLALGMIGIVMICRFFDLKMSLTVKGILFIIIGSCFFLANYLILKNRKHENKH